MILRHLSGKVINDDESIDEFNEENTEPMDLDEEDHCDEKFTDVDVSTVIEKYPLIEGGINRVKEIHPGIFDKVRDFDVWVSEYECATVDGLPTVQFTYEDSEDHKWYIIVKRLVKGEYKFRIEESEIYTIRSEKNFVVYQSDWMTQVGHLDESRRLLSVMTHLYDENLVCIAHNVVNTVANSMSGFVKVLMDKKQIDDTSVEYKFREMYRMRNTLNIEDVTEEHTYFSETDSYHCTRSKTDFSTRPIVFPYEYKSSGAREKTDSTTKRPVSEELTYRYEFDKE